MKKLYRDLTPEARAAYGITEDGKDESWVYCTSCERVMPQGDCVLDEQGRLQCAYEDCTSAGGAALQNLRPWDEYAQEQGGRAAHWPEKPEVGKRYSARHSDLGTDPGS
jgi:hypothetical protein